MHALPFIPIKLRVSFLDSGLKIGASFFKINELKIESQLIIMLLVILACSRNPRAQTSGVDVAYDVYVYYDMNVCNRI